MICADSDFIIDLLRGEKEAIDKLRKYGSNLVTTEISVFEVFYGIFSKKIISKHEDSSASSFFNDIDVLSLGQGAGKLSAKIYSDLVKKGKIIEQNDCLISSIMIKNDCDTILTRNVKHFKRIKGIKVEEY